MNMSVLTDYNESQHPDRCVWWEAVNKNTGSADYHAHTKKKIIEIIDNKAQ